MCGINRFNFEDKKLIKKVNEILIHRGPNDEGIFIENNISLGSRRLSIIDLSQKGHQPMIYSYKDNKLTIVFNGEIYNYLELKKELIEKGHKFHNDSDTEVILASYSEWGENCVNKFNGMWAFCIHDSRKKTLFLSRDRLGQKPLYYFFDDSEYSFKLYINNCFESSRKVLFNYRCGISFSNKPLYLFSISYHS